MIKRIYEYFHRKQLAKPYRDNMSNIGFKAIGRSSEYRTLDVKEGKTYLPSLFTYDDKAGNKFLCYTDFIVTTEDGTTIKVTQSDIGTIFKVVPYARESNTYLLDDGVIV